MRRKVGGIVLEIWTVLTKQAEDSRGDGAWEGGQEGRGGEIEGDLDPGMRRQAFETK